jgi:hypothetical protein
MILFNIQKRIIWLRAGARAGTWTLNGTLFNIQRSIAWAWTGTYTKNPAWNLAYIYARAWAWAGARAR